MRANLVSRLGVATVILLALHYSSLTTAAERSTATLLPDVEARAARPWAGNVRFERTALTRIPHGGMLHPLSNLRSDRIASGPLASPPLTSNPIDGEWSLLAGSGQGGAAGPARIGHSAIYDPNRDRMVIFGGFTNDTWVLDLTVPQAAWVPLTTQGTPPLSRAFHTAVYDANSDRMVVYAGYSWDLLSDVWELDFTTAPPTWSQLQPAGSTPVARAGHTAIYDSDRDRMIVFAGYDGLSGPTERRKDVWSLSLGGNPEWTELTPAVDGPTARSSHEAVYDDLRQAMVVFGGTDTDFRNDVWALSLGGIPEWTPIAAAGLLPAAREEHSMIYDAGNDRLIIYGGYDATFLYGDTWTLSLANPPLWTELEPTGFGPGPRWGHTAVYDHDGARAILFGGGTNYRLPTGTFVLSLSGPPSWSHPLVGPGPGPVRHTFASAYDSHRHRMVLFGGSNVASYLNSSWTITLDDHPVWSQLTTAGTPPAPRRLVEGIYDPEGDRIIVFGGWDDRLFGDLWQLSFATNPPTWSVLVTTGGPPAARAGHGVIYDPRGHRMILFAGWDGVSENYRRNDLWALNLDPAVPEWEQLAPVGTPPSPRGSHSLVYDSDRHRMLVFGGSAYTFLNEVWALSLDDLTWVQLAPFGTPPSPREEQSAIYDPVRERLVIFGGYDNLYFYGSQDLWELTLRGQPQWRQLTPDGPTPIYRWGHAAVYDRERDRMVMHGGLGPGLDETWALTWSHPETAVPALTNVEVLLGEVRLTWSLFGGAFLHANVYRSLDGSAWAWAGSASLGSDGQAQYEDHNVQAGLRYAYRASVMAGSTERYSEVTWVDIPGATDMSAYPLAFRLDAVHPNPVVREMSLSFSLPDQVQGAIEILDTAGRRVWSRPLSAFGPGQHTVRLGREAKLPSGVYLVKLSQGARSQSRKVCVIGQ